MRPAFAALSLLTVAALSGCGSGTQTGAVVDQGQSPTPAAAMGGHATVGDLTITGAYIPKPATATLAAAYFTVTDTGAADRLVSISSPEFASAKLHKDRTTGDGGEIMVPVEHPLSIPSHGRLTLQPGGYHVMLRQPGHAVKRGATVPLTLRFANAGKVTMSVPVVGQVGLPGGDMSGMNMGSG